MTALVSCDLPVLVPHLAGCADHRGHGRIDNDVARHVKVGDAFGGIHHGDIGTAVVFGLNVGFDLLALRFRQFLNALQKIAEAVVRIDAEFGKVLRRASGKHP